MDHTRHSGLFNARNLWVSIVGVGGIGSVTALTLVKMGVGNLDLYDPDVVGQENLATQLFRLSDVGMLKTQAVADIIYQFSDDAEICTYDVRVDSEDEFNSDIVIMAVDSIAARKDIFAALNECSAVVDWFIDTRMAAEQLQIWTVPLGDEAKCKMYASALDRLNDQNVPDEPCTSKATYYCANTVAGWVGRIVKDIAVGEIPPVFLQVDLKKYSMFVP